MSTEVGSETTQFGCLARIGSTWPGFCQNSAKSNSMSTDCWLASAEFRPVCPLFDPLDGPSPRGFARGFETIPPRPHALGIPHIKLRHGDPLSRFFQERIQGLGPWSPREWHGELRLSLRHAGGTTVCRPNQRIVSPNVAFVGVKPSVAQIQQRSAVFKSE